VQLLLPSPLALVPAFLLFLALTLCLLPLAETFCLLEPELGVIDEGVFVDEASPLGIFFQLGVQLLVLIVRGDRRL